MSEHQEYVEMCALYTSGDLSDEQLKSLADHLGSCFDCRRAFNEFQVIESMGMAALMPDLTPEFIIDNKEPVAERMARRLLGRIEDAIHACQSGAGADTTHVPLVDIVYGMRRPPHTQGESAGFSCPPSSVYHLTHKAFRFSRVLLPCAAAMLMAIISIYSFHLGAKRVADVSAGKLRQAEIRTDSLETKITDLSKERDGLGVELQEKVNTINTLTEKIRGQFNQITWLKEQEETLADRVRSAEAQRLASNSERDVLSRKLANAQAFLAAMQEDLARAREQQSSESLQAASLAKRIDELSTEIKDDDQTIHQQRDLLSYDRDIRDLIGARDLYVAEVTDVGGDAETKKPFGRVFFTKGKSLIFYAYDLDKQPGVRRTSVYRAWGRRGSDFKQALPLGILYLDSPSNRRWVLKFDDPKALATIDAVFVTIEPRRGGRKPSGKPLLFAYLKVAPNHP